MQEYKHKLQNIISTNFDLTDKSADGMRDAMHLVQDVADSFGGCAICWGRGFLDDDQWTLCECERGKHLGAVIAFHNAAAR